MEIQRWGMSFPKSQSDSVTEPGGGPTSPGSAVPSGPTGGMGKQTRLSAHAAQSLTPSLRSRALNSTSNAISLLGEGRQLWQLWRVEKNFPFL